MYTSNGTLGAILSITSQSLRIDCQICLAGKIWAFGLSAFAAVPSGEELGGSVNVCLA